MSNVRFYKLDVLPGFDSSKYVGIFVHVTTGDTAHKAGLWFGGAAGWEYLTNDTNAINAAIDAKIQELDVTGYAQATISTIDNETGKSSTLTIYGIQETDGKIGIYQTSNFGVAIDGVYDRGTNKIATQDTVNNKIATLDASAFQTVTKSTNGVNTVLTFNGIKEVDGIISQGVTENAETLTVGNANLKIQIGSNENEAFGVFSANAIKDSTIKLDGNVFKKNGDEISVITQTPVALDNRLVTEKDVANLAGAMHYKKAIASDTEWPKTVAAGDVYIASGDFEHGDGSDAETIESGDLIVFNTDSVNDYTVVQSNITLGINSGQIAKNDGNLTPNNMVIATSNGIKTIGISENDLTDTTEKNKRTLTYANGTADTTGDITLYHSATITDTFKVIGKDFSKTINISSANRSIEIARNAGENDSTGILVDLVWNTSIE